MTDKNETVMMSVYVDEHTPTGLGFEGMELLSESEKTMKIAFRLANNIKDKLPEEAVAIMKNENVPLFEIRADNQEFWGEWCDSDAIRVEAEMNELLQSIAQDFKDTAVHS